MSTTKTKQLIVELRELIFKYESIVHQEDASLSAKDKYLLARYTSRLRAAALKWGAKAYQVEIGVGL